MRGNPFGGSNEQSRATKTADLRAMRSKKTSKELTRTGGNWRWKSIPTEQITEQGKFPRNPPQKKGERGFSPGKGAKKKDHAPPRPKNTGSADC